MGEEVPYEAKALKTITSLREFIERLEAKKETLAQNQKVLLKEKTRLESVKASSSGAELVKQAKEVNGVKYLVSRFDDAGDGALRDVVDQIRNKLGSSIVLLASVDGDKISLVAGVTKDTTDKIKAGDLMKEIAPLVGGKGGGRPDMAQGGGTEPDKLADALKHAEVWLQEQLQE